MLHRRCEVAGVFVNATLDEVALAADRFGLSLLQLHGDEGPAYCREAARRTGAKVMKAVRVKDAASVRDLGAFHTDFHLLDANVPGMLGGTGETFSWDLAKAHLGDVPLVLSGGITPGQRRRRGPPGAPVRGRQRQRHRGAARPQGPGQGGGAVRRGRAPPTRSSRPHERRRGRRGRERDFGPYGGRFVPETLIPALDELEAAWLEARSDAEFGRELDGAAARLRRAPDPALPRARAVRAGGRQGLPQARGPAAHRRAQDQQRDRPGAAGQADGQAARDRRDGRGPARSGGGHGVRAAGPRMRGVHGHRGHAPPAARTSSGWACWARRWPRSRPEPAR